MQEMGSDSSKRIVIVDPNVEGGHPEFCHSLARLLVAGGIKVTYINREHSIRSSGYVHRAMGCGSKSRLGTIQEYWAMLGALLSYSKTDTLLLFESLNAPIQVLMCLVALMPGRRRRVWVDLHNAKPHGRGFLEGFLHRTALVICRQKWVEGVVYHYRVLRLDHERERIFGIQVSSKMKYVPHHFFLPAEEVRNLQRQANYKRVESPKKLNLLIFGVIRQNKGVPAFLEKLKSCEGIANQLHVRIVGKCDEQEAVRIRALSRDPVLSRVVELCLSAASNEEKERLFKWCDLVVLPYREDFIAQSGVVLDAFAHGKPLLISNNSSLMLHAEVDRAAVPIGDNLESTLRSIIENEERLSLLRQAVLEVSREEYSDQSCVAAYFSAFRSSEKPSPERQAGEVVHPPQI